MALSSLSLSDALALCGSETHLKRERGLLILRQRVPLLHDEDEDEDGSRGEEEEEGQRGQQEERETATSGTGGADGGVHLVRQFALRGLQKHAAAAAAATSAAASSASASAPPAGESAAAGSKDNDDGGASWEGLFGAVSVASIVLARCQRSPGQLLFSSSASSEGARVSGDSGSGSGDAALAEALLHAAPLLLEHREVRVRAACADALEAAARFVGAERAFGFDGPLSVRPALMAAIRRDFARDAATSTTPRGDGQTTPADLTGDDASTNDTLHDEDGVETRVGMEHQTHTTSHSREYAPDATVVGEKKTELVHDTEGWRTLETSFKALQAVMRGAATTFAPFVDDELVDLLIRSGTHTNRFVRESGYFATGTLCAILAPSEGARRDALDEGSESGQMPGAGGAAAVPAMQTARPGTVAPDGAVVDGLPRGAVGGVSEGAAVAGDEAAEAGADAAARSRKFSDVVAKLVPAVAHGLADNWSQVRFSASVAARQLLIAGRDFGGLKPGTAVSVDDGDDAAAALLRAEWERELVPRMCLNRHYGAEGVRLYSQNTWIKVFGERGRGLVQRHIDDVVKYYSASATADNHSVREAACACIAELGTGKVSLAAVESHAAALLGVLVIAFRDESWPVRDAACLASAEFISAFPERAKSDPDFATPLADLWELWIDHLSDNIWSVREDSAVALGHVMRVLGAPAVDKVFMTTAQLLRKGLKQLPADETSRFANLSDKPAVFSVAEQRHARANDPDLHSNQQLYSCGSLAPKLKPGSGCMDCSFRRPPQLWESSDGGIYILRELAKIAPEKSALLIPILADLGELDYDSDAAESKPVFHEYTTLLETLMKQLPAIVIASGADTIQGALLLRFVRTVLRALGGGHRPTMSAAGYCLEELAKHCGPDAVEQLLRPEDRELIQKHSRFVRYPF